MVLAPAFRGKLIHKQYPDQRIYRSRQTHKRRARRRGSCRMLLFHSQASVPVGNRWLPRLFAAWVMPRKWWTGVAKCSARGWGNHFRQLPTRSSSSMVTRKRPPAAMIHRRPGSRSNM